MIYRIFLFSLALFQLALCQNYFITNPVESTVFQAGETVTISWIDAEAPEIVANSISIELVDGDSNNAQLVTVIAPDIPASAKSLEWTVPKDLKPQNSYFLRMKASSESGEESFNFSARFSILGGEERESDDADEDEDKDTPPDSLKSDASRMTGYPILQGLGVLGMLYLL